MAKTFESLVDNVISADSKSKAGAVKKLFDKYPNEANSLIDGILKGTEDRINAGAEFIRYVPLERVTDAMYKTVLEAYGIGKETSYSDANLNRLFEVLTPEQKKSKKFIEVALNNAPGSFRSVLFEKTTEACEMAVKKPDLIYAVPGSKISDKLIASALMSNAITVEGFSVNKGNVRKKIVKYLDGEKGDKELLAKFVCKDTTILPDIKPSVITETNAKNIAEAVGTGLDNYKGLPKKFKKNPFLAAQYKEYFNDPSFVYTKKVAIELLKTDKGLEVYANLRKKYFPSNTKDFANAILDNKEIEFNSDEAVDSFRKNFLAKVNRRFLRGHEKEIVDKNPLFLFVDREKSLADGTFKSSIFAPWVKKGERDNLLSDAFNVALGKSGDTFKVGEESIPFFDKFVQSIPGHAMSTKTALDFLGRAKEKDETGNAVKSLAEHIDYKKINASKFVTRAIALGVGKSVLEKMPEEERVGALSGQQGKKVFAAAIYSDPENIKYGTKENTPLTRRQQFSVVLSSIEKLANPKLTAEQKKEYENIIQAVLGGAVDKAYTVGGKTKNLNDLVGKNKLSPEQFQETLVSLAKIDPALLVKCANLEANWEQTLVAHKKVPFYETIAYKKALKIAKKERPDQFFAAVREEVEAIDNRIGKDGNSGTLQSKIDELNNTKKAIAGKTYRVIEDYRSNFGTVRTKNQELATANNALGVLQGEATELERQIEAKNNEIITCDNLINIANANQKRQNREDLAISFIEYVAVTKPEYSEENRATIENNLREVGLLAETEELTTEKYEEIKNRVPKPKKTTKAYNVFKELGGEGSFDAAVGAGYVILNNRYENGTKVFLDKDNTYGDYIVDGVVISPSEEQIDLDEVNERKRNTQIELADLLNKQENKNNEIANKQEEVKNITAARDAAQGVLDLLKDDYNNTTDKIADLVKERDQLKAKKETLKEITKKSLKEKVVDMFKGKTRESEGAEFEA